MNDARGLDVPWPSFADQLEPALARIGALESRRTQLRRRLVTAVAAAALVAGALAAVAGVRAAFLHLFTFGRERIELVDRLPPLTERRTLALGKPTTLAVARVRVRYRVALPDLSVVGAPTTVHVTGSGHNEQLALLWGTDRRFSLLFSEVPLSDAIGVHEQLIARKRLVHPPVPVFVGAHPGQWIQGFHEYMYLLPTGEQRFSTSRPARNVLLWHAFGLQLRLEGRMTLAEALTIARTVSPHAEARTHARRP
jgi:hypothetical protein